MIPLRYILDRRKIMDEFNGLMAIGTGWVAILMPVLIVWVIFYYSTKDG